MISIGPVGRIVRGNVLDVSKTHLERALKDYDSSLYVVWNPNKCAKNGCWEVRRRPPTKSVKEVMVWEGNTYCVIDYVESDIVHHVMNATHLDYNILTRLKAMDTWKHKNWQDDMEYAAKKHQVQAEEKALSELKYNIKQIRSAGKELKEYALSGGNLNNIARYWGKK